MLIVIEGIDGSGKSTLANDLAHALKAAGNPTVLTREPGGSALGKSLREILQTQPVPITPIAEFLLFAADRAQHFSDVVMPALQQKNIVISDRMGDSSLVYQGFGRGIDKQMIQSVNTWAMQNKKPDITFYLKITPEIAQKRLQERKKLTAFEKEQTEFVYKLIDGFNTIYTDRTDVITLDGSQSPSQVTANALKALKLWNSAHITQPNQIHF